MPKFSDQERDNIRETLKNEGKQLFARLGLKKVTIDDIVNATGIAKATFYTFYENKESLFLDIVQSSQREIFILIESGLMENRGLSSRVRVKQVFVLLEQYMTRSQVISQIDSQTLALIARKAPNELKKIYTQQNIDAAETLSQFGIRFTCDVKTASIIFQGLYHSFIGMRQMESEDWISALDLMLEAIIDKIITEEAQDEDLPQSKSRQGNT